MSVDRTPGEGHDDLIEEPLDMTPFTSLGRLRDFLLGDVAHAAFKQGTREQSLVHHAPWKAIPQDEYRAGIAAVLEAFGGSEVVRDAGND